MVFKGKKKRGYFLICKKRRTPFSLQSPCRPSLQSPFRPKTTSTPVKKCRPSNQKMQLQRTPGKSPAYKRRRKSHDLDMPKTTPRKCLAFNNEKAILESMFEARDIEEEMNLCSDEHKSDVPSTEESVQEETYIYCDEYSSEQEILPDASDTINKTVQANNDSIQDLIDSVMKAFETHGVHNEFIVFLKLVAEGKFPLNNVAFMLFVDVIKWFNTEDVRSMRYSDTTMKFFWLGQRLFGGRFLRFMSGPKNETDFVLGKRNLNPLESKINFAGPSRIVLSQYNPLGYEISADRGPGLITEMIDLLGKNSSNNSYVLMFDGKKIKRGTDTDLLGFEKEPQSARKAQHEADINVINKTSEILQNTIRMIETEQEVTSMAKQELGEYIRKCFDIFSRCLMNVRKTKKAKEFALAKYKAKIEKDPSLSKTFQYAIDSCRTMLYVLENSVDILLDAQWELCKTGAFLNGVLDTFAKSKYVAIERQTNVHLLKSVEEMKADLNTDDLPTNQIKQRSEEWIEARKNVKVTGSVLYSALGCDGLKRQNEHFDSVFSEKTKHFSDEQEKAMLHGVESEVHEIATLASVIIPFLFPEQSYYEEGYYMQDRIIVSPDGSMKDHSGVVYAFEGKAPSEKSFTTRQQYSVPERYILQTLFEQKAMSAEKGTIYLCWTPESTTAFFVPKDLEICSFAEDIVHELYHSNVPKRRTKILDKSKILKQKVKDHVNKCIYLGEFPSVRASENLYNLPDLAEQSSFKHRDTARALLKAKTAMKEIYKLGRNYASQVVVFLLADLDRLWKSELPHAVPVMYVFRGYSLPMDLARKLLEHCWNACADKGLDIVTASSDGEFIQMMVRGKQDQPLTLYQLNKMIWSEVCKYSKAELVYILGSLNKTYKTEVDDKKRISIKSIDGGNRIKTPKNGWRTKTSRKMTDAEINLDKSRGKTTDTSATDSDNTTMEDGDDTIDYDYETILQDGIPDFPEFPRYLTSDETEDVLLLLKETGKRKWIDASANHVAEEVKTSLYKFTKDELLSIAKYLNLKLIGTKHEIRVKRVKKGELLEQLKHIIKIDTDMPVAKQKIKAHKRNPKSLQELAKCSLKKSTYPKQVLNIAYATYIWPDRVKKWKEDSKVADEITVKMGSSSVTYHPYHVPEFEEKTNDFRVFTYDKTHLGTNLRKCLCLDKVSGISIQAGKRISENRPDILHPTLIEVNDDGKILDQMKEKLARSMLTKEVEDEMLLLGFKAEAEFCRVFREGLYVADDTPGVSAIDRCKKRLALIQWLSQGVNFGQFPPYGSYIKGISHILYEGLRTSQEAKLLLYPIAKAGTYCVRAPNTLCSESFFGSMQEMDPWGQGI